MNQNQTHEKYLNRTFELAELSVKKGNHPFGAVLVIDNKIVLEAENTVTLENDRTKHAELNLVSKASKQFTKQELKHATIYSSTEPCEMCSGAIYWVGIRNIVFGCSKENLNKMANEGLDKEPTNTTGPLLEEKACELHKAFWPAKHLKHRNIINATGSQN